MGRRQKVERSLEEGRQNQGKVKRTSFRHLSLTRGFSRVSGQVAGAEISALTTGPKF